MSATIRSLFSGIFQMLLDFDMIPFRIIKMIGRRTYHLQPQPQLQLQLQLLGMVLFPLALGFALKSLLGAISDFQIFFFVTV